MGLSNAERQARWCTKWDAEIERLRKVAAEQSEQLAEAQREIEIVALARENAALKMALAHERKQHAAGIASLMKANRELRAKLDDALICLWLLWCICLCGAAIWVIFTP